MSNWATKWWKKDTKKNKKTVASSYWYDDYSSDFDYSSFYGDFADSKYDTAGIKAMQKSLDTYKLSATRRAVSNFVNIVTGRKIPVEFAGKSSHTDGTSVVISADIDDSFDVGVGLALHEASHIVLSDFNLLKVVSDCINTYEMSPDAVYLSNHFKDYSKYSTVLDRVFCTKNGLMRHSDSPAAEVRAIVGDVLLAINNWIEDRRIDSYIYKNSPGYRQYYLSMYDHYFNDSAVTKGIESDEYTEENLESYLFRIINLNNEQTRLDKLKGLRKIFKMLDLANVSRLKTTTDSLNLSIDVVEEIYKNIGSKIFKKPGNQTSQGDGSGENEIEITDVKEGESNDTGGSAGQVGSNMTGQATMQVSKNSGNASGQPTKAKVKMSAKALEKLAKLFEKQKKFLQSNVKKKKLSAADAKSIASIDESGGELRRVGVDYGHGSTKGVDCILLKRVTKATLDSDEFDFGNNDAAHYSEQVAEGIRLGTILGNKLSIRSESRDTVYNRLNKGKIDRRLISSLGFGSESVFYNKEVDQYKKANIHISLDYSGSMGGKKIEKMVTCVSAIVKAASMARNITVQVSIRSTTYGRSRIKPIIANIYDSRRDTLKSFCYVMERLHTTNTTPEGLCFEAIMKEFIPTTKDVDSYFLNFSDGEPAYAETGFNYQGRMAAEHTAKQVKRIKETGINVLSYFISEYSDEASARNSHAWNIFRQCYGDSARVINPTNMFDVAKTMNEMFLKKGN